MAQSTGIDSIDRAVEKTYEWVRDLRQELGDGASRQQALTMLRTVLQALRDRLTVDEAAEFAAQLPLLIRGIYYEGWAPSQTPVKLDRERFLTRIEMNANLPDDVSAEGAARAMGKVLRRRVDAGELGDVLASLPSDLRSLLDQ
jgi:uncharacterized protein (DUF2267 family)